MTWNLSELEVLLAKNDSWAVCRENDCLCVTNEDGLDGYVAVSGEQIVVESVLFGKNQVADPVALNEEILKTQQMFPLTSVVITTVAGEDYYTALGALSSKSEAESIVIEVDTLFRNVIGFLDAYERHIN